MIIHAGPLPSKERVEKLECYLQLEHAGVTCDGCGCAPIIGLRYARAGKDYDLCGKCFDGQRADEQVHFERVGTPRSTSDERAAVRRHLAARRPWSSPTARSVLNARKPRPRRQSVPMKLPLKLSGKPLRLALREALQEAALIVEGQEEKAVTEAALASAALDGGAAARLAACPGSLRRFSANDAEAAVAAAEAARLLDESLAVGQRQSQAIEDLQARLRAAEAGSPGLVHVEAVPGTGPPPVPQICVQQREAREEGLRRMRLRAKLAMTGRAAHRPADLPSPLPAAHVLREPSPRAVVRARMSPDAATAEAQMAPLADGDALTVEQPVSTFGQLWNEPVESPANRPVENPVEGPVGRPVDSPRPAEVTASLKAAAALKAAAVAGDWLAAASAAHILGRYKAGAAAAAAEEVREALALAPALALVEDADEACAARPAAQPSWCMQSPEMMSRLKAHGHDYVHENIVSAVSMSNSMRRGSLPSEPPCEPGAAAGA